MGIGEFSKKLAKAAFYGGDKTNDIQNLAIPMDRIINLNPEGNELEWLEAVTLYENTYADLRMKHGWKIVKGWDFYRDGDRFEPVRWQVGEVIVHAKYLTDEDGMRIGVVEEKVIKS